MLVLLALAAVLQSAPAPAAREPEPTRTITMTVVDEKGSPVRGLTTADVAVLRGGATLTPVRLEEDRRPLTVALILDTSQPTGTALRLNLIDATIGFLARLPEGSRFALWTTGDRPTKVVDFTTDRGEAARRLRRVHPVGGNTLLDAVVEAAKDLQDAEGARSALVVITGLGPGFTGYDRRQVVDRLKDRALMVHAVTVDERGSLDPSAQGGDVGGADYDFVLAELTRATGGHLDNVLAASGVDRALLKIAGLIQGQYRLTYEDAVPVGRGQKLEVTVARPGAKVRIAQRS